MPSLRKMSQFRYLPWRLVLIGVVVLLVSPFLTWSRQNNGLFPPNVSLIFEYQFMLQHYGSNLAMWASELRSFASLEPLVAAAVFLYPAGLIVAVVPLFAKRLFVFQGIPCLISSLLWVSNAFVNIYPVGLVYLFRSWATWINAGPIAAVCGTFLLEYAYILDRARKERRNYAVSNQPSPANNFRY